MVGKRSIGEKLFDTSNIFLLGILGLTAIYPFIYTVTISLSTAAEASREGLHFFPRQISFYAYKIVFSNPDIFWGYSNTLFRTIVGTALKILFTAIFAYPLSKPYLPHRKTITFLIMFTMLFSGGLVPMYLLYLNIDLIDNIWVYVIPALTSPFDVIIIKSFFQQIPESYAESAAIDGAGPWRTLFHIYIPLSKPVLATVALWTAVFHWNMWFDSMLFINTETKNTMQLFLRRIVIEGSTELVEKGIVNPDVVQYTPETIKAATVVITIIPILIVYPFLQKYFVKGITLGGVKG